jgi:hypothetical protein
MVHRSGLMCMQCKHGPVVVHNQGWINGLEAQAVQLSNVLLARLDAAAAWLQDAVRQHNAAAVYHSL